MTRMSREDWLELGLARLSAVGPEALKLEAICEAADKTRGSFYHHFSDIDSFLHAMVAHWRVTRVTAMIDVASPETVAHVPPEEMVDMVIQLDYRLEIGLRELARRHSDAARELARADEQRLDFTQALYQIKFDLPPDDARDIAMLDYAAFTGVILMNPDMPRADQVRICSRFYQMTEATYGKGRQ